MFVFISSVPETLPLRVLFAARCPPKTGEERGSVACAASTLPTLISSAQRTLSLALPETLSSLWSLSRLPAELSYFSATMLYGDDYEDGTLVKVIEGVVQKD